MVAVGLDVARWQEIAGKMSGLWGDASVFFWFPLLECSRIPGPEHIQSCLGKSVLQTHYLFGFCSTFGGFPVVPPGASVYIPLLVDPSVCDCSSLLGD